MERQNDLEYIREQRRTGAVSMRALAAASGVHLTTVHAALNGKRDVKHSTVAKMLKAFEDNGATQQEESGS